jgi:ATP-dependent DNA helicase DinG
MHGNVSPVTSSHSHPEEIQMSWTDAQDAFRRTLPGYEDRPQQTRLAQTIEKALANKTNIMAQASTGTGKSYSALIPAIEHSLRTGLPVVVATETKALQSQYSKKDIPFLKEHLGIKFAAVELKGKSNYICRAAVSDLAPGQVFNQQALLEEIETNPDMSGDLEDLITEIDLSQRSMLTITSEECPGASSCLKGKECFPEIVKANARTAQIIIVNHHLLMTDVMIRMATRDDENPAGRGIIPHYGALIVDEAHSLQEVATNVLGQHFTEKSLQRFSADVGGFLDDVQSGVPLGAAAHQLFRELARLLRRERTASLTSVTIEPMTELFARIADEMRVLIGRINSTSTHGDDQQTMRKARILKRARNLLTRFMDIVLTNDDQMVRWVAKETFRGQDTIELHYAPLDVAPVLRDMLWEQHTSVLMSATLAVGGDFSFLGQQLGMDNPMTFDAGTPFDYPNQAAFFCPAKNCDPKSDEWSARCAIAIEQLITAADGRALVLFTSRRELEAAWEATHEIIEDQGITVLKQVAGGNNRALGEEFKQDERSVLFALKSFMTGFDVQGDSLQLVILNKLPFANPSDVILAARADAMDRAARNKWVDGSFPRMTVPSMTLVLLQAFGRLIRTKTDRGAVVLLDDRLFNKKYGATIRKALPPARQLKDLSEAREYLRSLRAPTS